MQGVTVKVMRPDELQAKDAHGNPVKVWSPEVVENVLVNKPNTDDLTNSSYLTNGYTLSYQLAFPKTWNESLLGCKVVIPGDPMGYDVIGDPRPVPHNCPTAWNYTVLIGRAHG